MTSPKKYSILVTYFGISIGLLFSSGCHQVKVNERRALEAIKNQQTESSNSTSEDPVNQNSSDQTNSNNTAQNQEQISLGLSLYEDNCKGCHGISSSHNIKDTSSEAIEKAIEQISMMSFLNSKIKKPESDAISAALDKDANSATNSQSKDTNTLSGLALYDANCKSCHNSISQTTIKNKTPKSIKWSIIYVEEMNTLPALTSLNDLEITKIAESLNQESTSGTTSTTPPESSSPPQENQTSVSNGLVLYDQYCKSCHFSIDKSDVKGEDSKDIQDAILQVRSMKHLSSLTTSQVSDIANALK